MENEERQAEWGREGIGLQEKITSFMEEKNGQKTNPKALSALFSDKVLLATETGLDVALETNKFFEEGAVGTFARLHPALQLMDASHTRIAMEVSGSQSTAALTGTERIDVTGMLYDCLWQCRQPDRRPTHTRIGVICGESRGGQVRLGRGKRKAMRKVNLASALHIPKRVCIQKEGFR